jgi:hypothetical protein
MNIYWGKKSSDDSFDLELSRKAAGASETAASERASGPEINIAFLLTEIV